MSTVKAPTRAVRAAVNASAAAFSSNQSLSNVVRMIAGHAEAKADVLAGVVYNAYYQALRHGNKAQLQGRENSLFEQAKMYSKQANAKAAGFAQPKKAADYYAAHLCALEGVGVPGKATVEDIEAAELAHFKGAEGVIKTVDIIETMAEGMTLAYMGMVDTYLADIAAAAAAKRAESKAVKADTPKPANSAAADAVAAAVQAAAADQATPAAAPALADMVSAVAAALVAGALSVEQHNALADAIEMANTLAVAAALAKAGAAEEDERVNADAELEEA